ncbi:MAG TPA: LuxR C-terminal-related transcriptional regulator [Burkholderiaceae bacterium]|nr:LuxR C-terminal-related transcriptional regulator [Burkholderiaceae bacterium]
MRAADLSALAEIALSATGVKTASDFETWCRTEVRRLVPYGTLLCVAGQVHAGLIVIDALYPIDYPAEYLVHIQRQAPLTDRRVIATWLATRQPQIVVKETAEQSLSPLELREFSLFELRNIAAHGVIEPDACQATYFSFSRMPEPLLPDIGLRLSLVVPYLHQTFCNVRAQQIATRSTSDRSRLTERDYQVLRGFMLGMTNAEIAKQVHRSPHTIKHQIAALMHKLGTSNRTETVAKAMSMGIVIPTAVRTNAK